MNKFATVTPMSTEAPPEWLLQLAAAIREIASDDEEGHAARRFRRAVLGLLEEAVAEMDSAAPERPADDRRAEVRRLLTTMLTALPLTGGHVAPDIGRLLASSGDGWLTALWIVLEGVGTVHLWPDDWTDIDALSVHLERGVEEPLVAWFYRRDEAAAHYIDTHLGSAEHRRALDQKLRETLRRVFGSVANGLTWMTSGVGALGGYTPISTWRKGPRGVENVLMVLGAIEGGTYL